MTDGRSSESGFSLVELLVAMTITLIVSGAIYGLLAGGQSAFRREPELTERQQNIRMAMDLIMRDVGNAGVGMPALVQAFRDGLNGTAASPMGPNNQRADELEMIAHTGRDSEPVCPDPGSGAQQVSLVRGGVPVPVGTVLLLSTWEGRWTARRVTAVTNNASAIAAFPGVCFAGAHTQLAFAAGDPSGLNPGGGPCVPSGLAGYANSTYSATCAVTAAHFAEVVRYRVRNDTDGVPVLQRQSSARWDAGFQTIARGIEDLQVEYAPVDPALGTWLNSPPLVTGPPASGYAGGGNPPAPVSTLYGPLTRHVRVTLSARSEAQRVQGMQTAASGPTALRGSLTTTGSPRSVLFNVARGRPASPSPVPAYWWE